MLIYPQLLHGGLAQFPLARERKLRSAAAKAGGGAYFARYDQDAGTVVWTLLYQGLSAVEMGILRDFFEAAEGRLSTFVFADPMANLLRWSGDLRHSVWETTLATVSETGEPDPFGRQEAFRVANPGGTMQGLAQALAAPGGYEYVFSVWLRGESGSRVRIAIADSETEFVMEGGWTRHEHSAIPGVETGVRFAIEAPPGGECLVYGPQVEAQKAASAYKKAGGGGAIYTKARFDMDELECRLDGPSRYTTEVRIRSKEQG